MTDAPSPERIDWMKIAVMMYVAIVGGFIVALVLTAHPSSSCYPGEPCAEDGGL